MPFTLFKGCCRRRRPNNNDVASPPVVCANCSLPAYACVETPAKDGSNTIHFTGIAAKILARGPFVSTPLALTFEVVHENSATYGHLWYDLVVVGGNKASAMLRDAAGPPWLLVCDDPDRQPYGQSGKACESDDGMLHLKDIVLQPHLHSASSSTTCSEYDVRFSLQLHGSHPPDVIRWHLQVGEAVPKMISTEENNENNPTISQHQAPAARRVRNIRRKRKAGSGAQA